jgi:two-component system, LytTR family, response regulator
MAIKVLIVDDEPLARTRVAELLHGDPEVDLVGECATGRQAVESIRRLGPDLVFLDVQMPEMSGFDVIRALEGGPVPVVIFVTAYDRYALDAFEVHALDYLLKPFSRSRFQSSLRHAKARLSQPAGGVRAADGVVERRIEELLRTLDRKPRGIERLAVKADGKVVFLRTCDIDWIEATGKYMTIHVKGKTHLIRETMAELEEKLDCDRFLRIHRSCIVNVERVKELHPMFNGEYTVVLNDGTRLGSSRGYREKIQELIDRSS